MISIACLMAVAAQGPDLEIRMSSRKREGAFELRVSGKGAALRGSDLVGLRFHRRVNRVNWKGRSIRTESLAKPWGRCAPVRDTRFVHHERFRAPVEVELRLILDGDAPDPIRIARVGSAADVARRLDRSARAAADVLASLGKLGSETASLLERPSRTRARSLIGRLERVRLRLVEESETGLVTAAVEAMLGLTADLQRAAEASKAVPACDPVLFSSTGDRISPRSIESAVDAVDEILERERALILVLTVAELFVEIDSAPARGRQALERAIAGLAAAAEDLERFRTEAGATPADLVAGVEEYLTMKAGPATFRDSDDSASNRWTCWIFEQIGELEDRLRTGP